MSNQIKPCDPALLPDELYLNIGHYLNKNSFNNLSLVSKKNYSVIYKLAIEALLMLRYRLECPSHLLTFFERNHPHLNKSIILGNKEDLGLLQKRIKNISFASNPRHSPLITILDRVFPERITSAKEIEKIRDLARGYQKWIREEIFIGPIGLEVPIFVQNIRRLIQKYEVDPTPSIFQILENAQAIFPSVILQIFRDAQAVFPSDTRAELISRLEQDPQIQIFGDPGIGAFQEPINRELTIQRTLQAMKDVKDVIADELNREWFLPNVQLGILISSLDNIVPSIQILLDCPLDIFAEQFALPRLESRQQLKDVLTLTLRYWALQQQQPFDYEVVFAQVNTHAYISQLEGLVLILQKGIEKYSAVLNKQNQHTSVLWRGILLEDRESLRCMIDSPAFLYFQWGEVLKNVLRNNQFDLFFHLISYPQIVDSLSLEEFREINCYFFTAKEQSLDKYDPSVLLPLLRHPSMVTVWEEHRRLGELMRFFLPAFLGECDISPFQWNQLCLLNLKSQPRSKIFGIILNALVQKGKTDLVRVFLSSDLQKKIPPTSSNLLIRFFSSKIPAVGWDTIFKNGAAHPHLLDLLASYPMIAVQMPQDLRNKHLPRALQAHVENFQTFSAPQEGSSRDTAERISRLMETYPSLLEGGWKTLQEKCSFFRRIALVFTLPKFLSSDRYNGFYKDLPFFYRIIGQIGKLWARFLGYTQ